MSSQEGHWSRDCPNGQSSGGYGSRPGSYGGGGGTYGGGGGYGTGSGAYGGGSGEKPASGGGASGACFKCGQVCAYEGHLSGETLAAEQVCFELLAALSYPA